jgi:hypothetical protein
MTTMVQFQQQRRAELRAGSPPATGVITKGVGSTGNVAHLFLAPTREIWGRINEVRKQFVSEDGLVGEVRFGGYNSLCKSTHIQVRLEDGRLCTGFYSRADNVRLRVIREQ